MKAKIYFLMIVVLMLVPSLVNAAILSNLLVVDDIEYYIQTDASVYDLGENVEMLYRVTNLGSQDATFNFPQSPEWNFWANTNEENVWTAVDSWWTGFTSFTLIPNESKEFSYSWDMIGNNGLLVAPGNYDIVGGLYATSGGYEHTEVSVSILITPEPCSLVLLMAGMVVVVNKKR